MTEATLDENIITLTLTGAVYEGDISKIRDAVTVSGITGVTVNTSQVRRLSDRRVSVQLDYDGTDFDTDSSLTFTIISEAIANHNGNKLTTEIPVTAIVEVVAASVVSPLTEETLDGSIVTLTLTDSVYEQDISKIRDAVTVSGITGVTVNTSRVRRLSDRRVSVQLYYDDTDFDTDSSLTFTIISEAIANHNGNKLTTEIPVTAIVEVVAASVVSPLTEETLDGSIVTLTLTGSVYEQDISKIRDAVTVSGINGVTVDTTTVRRLGDTIVAIELDYDDTDFFRDTAMIFNVAADAITNYIENALITELPVTASRNESLLMIFWRVCKVFVTVFV